MELSIEQLISIGKFIVGFTAAAVTIVASNAVIVGRLWSKLQVRLVSIELSLKHYTDSDDAAHKRIDVSLVEVTNKVNEIDKRLLGVEVSDGMRSNGGAPKGG